MFQGEKRDKIWFWVMVIPFLFRVLILIVEKRYLLVLLLFIGSIVGGTLMTFAPHFCTELYWAIVVKQVRKSIEKEKRERDGKNH